MQSKKSIRIHANQILGQKHPHRSQYRQNRTHDHQKPRQHALFPAHIFAKDSKVKRHGKNDANGECESRAGKGHDGVKGGDEDGDGQHDDNGTDADDQFEDPATRARYAEKRGGRGHLLRGETEEVFNCDDNRSSARGR